MAIKSNNFNVDKNGNMVCTSGTMKNINIKNGNIELQSDGRQVFKVMRDNDTSTMSYVTDDVIAINNGSDHVECSCMTVPEVDVYRSGVSGSQIRYNEIRTPILTQTSREEEKKNFEKLQNGLDIVRETEIYKYNLRSQSNNDKKHIGFVIGKNYKYSNQITTLNEEKEVGVDTYSMISVAYKAIQEQQEQIEQLQEKDKQKDEIIQNLLKRIEKLEGGQ